MASYCQVIYEEQTKLIGTWQVIAISLAEVKAGNRGMASECHVIYEEQTHMIGAWQHIAISCSWS